MEAFKADGRSMNGDRPKSSVMKRIAPEMTPVS